MTPSLPGSSFRTQIVVLTAAVTAFAMVMLTLVVQLVLADLSSRDVDRVLEDRVDAVIGAVQADETGSKLVVPDGVLEAGVAVFDDNGTLVAGSAPQSLHSEYLDLESRSVPTVVTVGESSRIQAKPFTTTEGLHGVVIVTERLKPYETAEYYALLVSLLTGLLTTAAAGFGAGWITRRALQPVNQMAQTAADWSERDLGRRFDLGMPSNELSALAGTLDTLLDKVSAAIRSEQRLTSELAHELRTPLTTVQGTADLALMRDDLSPETREDLRQISDESHRMAATITALLELARSEESLTEASTCSLVELVDEATRTTIPSLLEIVLNVTDQRLAVPHAIALRALSPVVENALRFARSRVIVSAAPGGAGMVHVLVEDDGPGVSGDGERIFEPGTTSGSGSGAGLGLAIARRMARSVGGDVELTNLARPTRFEIRLPRA